MARIDFLTTNLESPDCVNFLTCLVKHPNGDKKAQLDQPGLEPGPRVKSFPSEPDDQAEEGLNPRPTGHAMTALSITTIPSQEDHLEKLRTSLKFLICES